MEDYFLPAITCLGIALYLWLQQCTERVAPYREPLISEGDYGNFQPPQKMIAWILRNYNEGSRLYSMIQYIHTSHGIKQVVIVPDESKVPLNSEIPILEFFQKTEIVIAIQQATYIFSEAKVMETAVITAKRANKPIALFIHDESSDSELRKVLPLYKETRIFYTSKWTEERHEWVNRYSLQIYIPVFMKEFQTHTTQEKIVCFCKNSQTKFQRIAADFPTYTFLYAPDRMKRASIYSEMDILCVFDMATPYEVVLEASASGIPVVVQWNPLYEEIFEDNCIYIKNDDDWIRIISLLKRNQLFYRQQSQKSLKMSLLYDSSRKMDMFLNCVFSEINNV